MTSKQALSKLKNDKKYSDEVINAIENDINKLYQIENMLKKNKVNDFDDLKILCKYAEYSRRTVDKYKEKINAMKDFEVKEGIDILKLITALKQEKLYVRMGFEPNATIQNALFDGIKSLSLVNGHLAILATTIIRDKTTNYLVTVPVFLFLCMYGRNWALTKEELL